MFGGLPATGAIARTATNVRAGGRTPIAGIVHAATILAISLAAAPLAGYLTMPALAGLLILTAWLMSEPTRWGERMSLRPGDRALFFMTLILTVLSNLTIAIAIGSGAGLGLRLLRRNARASGLESGGSFEALANFRFPPIADTNRAGSFLCRNTHSLVVERIRCRCGPIVLRKFLAGHDPGVING